MILMMMVSKWWFSNFSLPFGLYTMRSPQFCKQNDIIIKWSLLLLYGEWYIYESLEAQRCLCFIGVRRKSRSTVLYWHYTIEKRVETQRLLCFIGIILWIISSFLIRMIWLLNEVSCFCVEKDNTGRNEESRD